MIVDLRLAIPAAVGWAATAVLIGLPGATPAVSIGLWLTAGLLAVVGLRVRPAAIIALALAAAALCSTAIAVQSPGRAPEWANSIAASGRSVDAVLVAGKPVMPGARSWRARLVSLDGRSLDSPVVVFGGVPEARVEPGTTLEVTAALDATEAGDDRAFVVFPDEAARPTRAPPSTLGWANDLRSGFRDVAARLPGVGGELLAGLALGDTTLVTPELDAAMKTASLTHLTAVSGANCAVVVGLVMLVGGALGIPRALRVVGSLLVLAAFVVLVTPEPSVQRAAVMAGVVLALLAAGQPVRGVPVLALAVLGLLIADPWLARSYGFVLSVLATAGLLLLAGPLAAVLERGMPRWIALVIAVPAAAQVACQPVIVLLDPSLPTYGVVANVLAAPAAPIATILGLVACVALAVVPPLGHALAAVAWAPAAWIGAVAEFVQGLPAARLPWPPGPVGVALLAAVGAVGIVAVLSSGRTRRRAVLALAASVVIYTVFVGGARLLDLGSRPVDWQYAACDVGQGDAMVVRSAGQVALIDTGPEPGAVSSCLSDLGIDHVDMLVLTHFDLDHVGGSSALVGRADTVIHGPVSGVDDQAMLDEFAAAGATVEQVSRGRQSLLGDFRWTVLWPPVRGAPEPGNAASVTLRFDGVGECVSGCLSGLFLGDLGEEAQSALLRLGPLERVDVVKVAHHGSADQDPELYAEVRATAGLIGVGADNGYGHPTSEALGMLAAAGTASLRTDENGLILLAPGDAAGAVTAWTQRAVADGGRD
ncbi:ComEC/Rec2 family competence protein [Schumannella luteola]